MKYTAYILLTLLLIGCSSNSKSESTTQTIEIIKEVLVPYEVNITTEIIKEIEVIKEVLISVPAICEECNCTVECEECNCTEEPVMETYYQISTATRNDETIQIRTYDEQGYILTSKNPSNNTSYLYKYDNNHNVLSFELLRSNKVGGFTYKTFDENNNTLTEEHSSGRKAILQYDENNNHIRIDIDYNGDGIYNVELFTYDENNNLIKSEYPDKNRIENRRYDENHNIIYSEILINDEVVQTETYTYEKFIKEIK